VRFTGAANLGIIASATDPPEEGARRPGVAGLPGSPDAAGPVENSSVPLVPWGRAHHVSHRGPGCARKTF